MYPVKNLDDRVKLIEQVEVGRVVRITTRNSERIDATVTAITPERISGVTVEPDQGVFTSPSKKVDIAIDDISKLELEKTSKKKTAIRSMIVGGVVTTIVVAVILLTIFGLI